MTDYLCAERCQATGPCFLAFSVPRQGSTCAGGRHRRSATGGAAYGIPNQWAISLSAASTPLTLPPVVTTSVIGLPDLIRAMRDGRRRFPTTQPARLWEPTTSPVRSELVEQRLDPHGEAVDLRGDGADQLLPRRSAGDDPDLAVRLTVEGQGRVERLVTIKLAAFDWNCPQFIEPRYTQAEVEAMLAPRMADINAHIEMLESRLPALKPDWKEDP